jgi:hypothetical protein
LIDIVRQMPDLAKSRLGKAAIYALMAGFGCLLAGGYFVGKPHLRDLGLGFGALGALCYVALFGIGLIAAVRFGLRSTCGMIRRSNSESGQAAP